MADITEDSTEETVGDTAPGRRRRTVPGGESAPLRLFCFHHAGGSAWSFAGWGRRLGPEIEVVPVALPPRSVSAPGSAGSVSTMGDLVREVAQRLAPALEERPYAFYGHSMGSLVAHGVTQRQLAAGRRPPVAFVTGAHRAPHLPAPELTMDLSDTAALELLLGLGGTGRLLRENPGRMSAVVERLRQDLLVSASYRYPAAEHRPLPCPVHVLHGSQDPLVPTAHAAAWQHHAAGPFSLRVLPGGHFFHKEHKKLFFEELRRALGATGADHRSSPDHQSPLPQTPRRCDSRR
ncbi:MULTISPECIES: alpha/beta fold hydrolase [unclassified Streptomyces]|uniref:thioesterase II family protein n=1 Tax=unclassified Streptomyces TaxID=2593676 RepID=UPI000370072B|nr:MULTISPECIES: alpha/beta fold hydrolase [unclassified Streptomyces]MYY06578.1 thioesterase [Streptomyces sp. SID4913]